MPTLFSPDFKRLFGADSVPEPFAVISLDFSAQATCPSARPSSLAQTVTACKAPRPCCRSWLHRAILPSTDNTGCSTPARSARRQAHALQPVGETGLKGGRPDT